jgi:large subunit ribosomal protein L13
MKTYSTRSSDLTPQWHVIDASGKTLGRLASVVATLLMGKHKPIYTPNLNTGDFVIVVNAAKVRVTGNKAQQKVYYRHSGYPGGLKSVTLERMMQTHPTRVIEYAVKGMLPHNRLGRDMLRRLKVYAGDTHPHQAQVGKSEGEGAVER